MPTALLLIDVVNDFAFEDGVRTYAHAKAIAEPLSVLKRRARQAGLPTIYINDNLGQWRSDITKLVAYCTRPESKGKSFVQTLRPDDDDYFVLKPMHSAFFQTPLDILLRHLGCDTLILTGLATNSCILCTAHDAKMRDLKLIVPEDCCSARSAAEHRQALDHLRQMAGARILKSSSLPSQRTMAGAVDSEILSNAEIADRLASLAQLL